MIIVYSKSNYILDELKKVPTLIKDLVVMTTLKTLKEAIKPTIQTTIIHNIDDFTQELPIN